MPQRIEVPGMGIVEFPDGMSDADIAGAIKKNMQPQEPAMGAGEAALIAAGRGTDKVVQGVRQAYNFLTGDKATLGKMAADEAEKDRLFKPLETQFPIAAGIGQAAPALAVPGGTTVLGAALASALPGVLSYGTPEERLKRGATDAAFGAAGSVAGKSIARALKPAGVGAAPISQDALQAAERIGYAPTPGQVMNSPSMQNLENYLLRTPGGSGVMQKARDANQAALNAAGAKAIGETATKLDEGVIASAKGRIGGELDRVWNNNNLKIDGNFINDVQGQLARAQSLNPEQAAAVNKQLQNLLQKIDANGEVPGSFVNNWQSELRLMAEGEKGLQKDILAKIRKATIDTFNRSVTGADAQALTKARGEYGALKTLTASNVAEAGDLSAARTAAAVRRQNPMAFRSGQVNGPLADVARVGEAFKSVPNPNSGNQVSGMMFGNPLTGVPLMLGNRALASAYMSPAGQRYFTSGLLDVGEPGLALLSLAGRGAAIPGGRGLLGVE